MTTTPASTVDLVHEQARTLASPRRRYGLLARALFRTMDVLYGRRASLPKFLVLELVARVPYQTWEHAAYLAITRHAPDTRLARRIYDRVQRAREQQDNEQWHLFILEDVLEHRGQRLGWFRHRLLPQVIALAYYQVSWLLYVLRPGLSHSLNADFEDHAEHEYMAFVAAHPELAEERCTCTVADDYGCFDSLADVLRQIALDERHHKEESLLELACSEVPEAGARRLTRRERTRLHRSAVVAGGAAVALLATSVLVETPDLRTDATPWALSVLGLSVATVLRVVAKAHLFASRWARACAIAAATSVSVMSAILAGIGALGLAGVDLVDDGGTAGAIATLAGSIATLVVLPVALAGVCVAAVTRRDASRTWRSLPTLATVAFLVIPVVNAVTPGRAANVFVALGAVPAIAWSAFAVATAHQDGDRPSARARRS